MITANPYVFFNYNYVTEKQLPSFINQQEKLELNKKFVINCNRNLRVVPYNKKAS